MNNTNGTNQSNLEVLIRSRLVVVEAERKELKNNVGWIVQYNPCGHAVEITPINPLVLQCRKNTNKGNLIRPSCECPICNHITNKRMYVRRVK